VTFSLEELKRMTEETRFAQLQLSDSVNADPHPRLLLEGQGIHAGEGGIALFLYGWHGITLEVNWGPTNPGC